MLYRPSLSVTTLRVFSIRAGLDASTVTPGSTAPDVSLTTPAMPLADACWADAMFGRSRTPVTRHARTPLLVRPIWPLLHLIRVSSRLRVYTGGNQGVLWIPCDVDIVKEQGVDGLKSASMD